MRKTVSRILGISLMVTACAFISIAQDTPPAPTETPAVGPGARPGLPGAASQDPQPYDKVITK
ncbi:MAG TPA: hypothetical protein VK612_01320, partial [Pyrinomonadaceae bacterium]|nr:hypothetical protein [Pyrinomonadaceae bacterium]